MSPFVKIDNIRVSDRFRGEFGDIKELAESIEKYGLLHPIVVRREDNTLIAGERRYRAHKELGRQEIEVKYLDEIDEILAKEIELEENIKRKNFTWPEEVQAKAELDRVKRERHGSSSVGRPTGDGKSGWSLRDTAIELKQSLGSVAMDIQLAEGLEKYPELSKEKTKTKAYNKLKLLRERELRQALTEAVDPVERGEVGDMLWHGDCLDLIKRLPDMSVDLVWTDPPWGVDIQDSKGGKSSIFYDDNPESVQSLLSRLFPELWRVLKEGSHIYVVLAMQNYEWHMSMLTSIGFHMDPIPLIGDKGSAGAMTSSYRYSSSYSPILFGHKPPLRELNKGAGQRNAFPMPRIHPDKRWHPAENPVEPIINHIENSTEPGDLVLDPFGGSGSTVEAALRCMRKGLAFEKDPSHYSKGIERISNFLGGIIL